MLGGPSRTESEEPVDGHKNKDDLYLFTRGQVFKKSGQRFSAPPRSFPFPRPSSGSGILKHPPPSFTPYPDSGFDTPCLSLLLSGHQDGYPSYSSHGTNHGYPSTSSTPAIPPPSLMSSMDLFSLDHADQLPMFGSTTNPTTTVGGVDPTGSASWLHHFGIPDGPSIGFGR